MLVHILGSHCAHVLKRHLCARWGDRQARVRHVAPLEVTLEESLFL